jgi:hypothetical protein
MDVGAMREAAAAGDAGVRLPADAAQSGVGGAAPLAIAPLVPPDREAGSGDPGPALPPALRAQSLVASIR